MNVLKTPLLRHQLGGEPIQQLRMTWQLTLGPEVFGGGNEATPEILPPDSIDDDAGDGGVLRCDQPFGEREPMRLGAFGKRIQDSRHACFDLRGWFPEITALENMSGTRLCSLCEHQRGGRRGPLR